MKQLYKYLLSLLGPLVILLLSFLVCQRLGHLTLMQKTVINGIPYLILMISAILACKFNRSRIFFVTISILFVLWFRFYGEKLFHDLSVSTANQLLYLLLPVNIILFSFLKERGIISIWGILRFFLLLSEVGIIYYLIQPGQKDLIRKLAPYLKVSLDYSHPTSLLVPAILFSLALMVLTLRVIYYRSSQDISFLGILIGLFYIGFLSKDFKVSIFYSAIGLLLFLSILGALYSMAFYDELTGLPSRRALNQDMMKLGVRYSIAMLDIDFFKKFNDSYGHDTGDEALKFIAASLLGVTSGGKAYRYGGEEFTILFPRKELDEILPALNHLREAISQREFIIRKKRKATKGSTLRNKKKRGNSSQGNKKIHIHVSIGAAQRDNTYKTPATVLKAADSALYRAKKKGRNCVSK